MANVFLISDTHFSHENILGFTDKDGNKIRNFSDVWEMNEVMVKNWNAVVKPDDIVWHLGDVYFGNRKTAGAILSRLNGQKFLIPGNHDRLNGDDMRTLYGQFQELHYWQVWKKEKMILTHVPLHPSTTEEGTKKGFVNIHGHIHQNKSPEGPYFCVCVEQINYTPIELSDLKERCQKI